MSKSVHKNSQRGAAILELSLTSFVFLMLLGGAADWGINIYMSQSLQNVAREGSRIASTLPNLIVNDTRVKDVITYRLESLPFSGLFSAPNITNTVPISINGIVNSSGITCDNEITVSVEVNKSFTFLKALGINSSPLIRNSTMRYQIQPICN